VKIQFSVSAGSAEALARWGEKIKHILITYFVSNMSAKNYEKWVHVCRHHCKMKVGRFRDAVISSTFEPLLFCSCYYAFTRSTSLILLVSRMDIIFGFCKYRKPALLDQSRSQILYLPVLDQNISTTATHYQECVVISITTLSDTQSPQVWQGPWKLSLEKPLGIAGLVHFIFIG